MHPQRQAQLDHQSVSSLRDTDSTSTWLGRIRGGEGSDAGDGNAGGAAGDGNAGGAAGGGAEDGNGGGGAGDPPPQPDPPPSDQNCPDGTRMARRQRRIKELEFAKPIKIKKPQRFEGRLGEDFDTWWILVQLYIQDQPEKFPKDEKTIDWSGLQMDKYAALWHIHRPTVTMMGIHPKSITGYVNALKLRFEDEDATHEAYAEVEKVR